METLTITFLYPSNSIVVREHFSRTLSLVKKLCSHNITQDYQMHCFDSAFLFAFQPADVTKRAQLN